MNNIGPRAVVSEIPYYTAFGIYLTVAVLNSSLYSPYMPTENLMNAILLLCTALLTVRELLYETYGIRTFLLLFAALFIAANALIAGTFYLAFPFLLIYAGRHIQLRRFFLFAAVLTLLLFLFIVGSAYAGIIENYKRVEVERGNNREYLGFLYALYPGTLLFNAAALLAAARKRRMHLLTAGLLLLAAFFVYKKTDGRLALIQTGILLLVLIVWKGLPRLLGVLRPLFFLTVWAFPVCAAASIFLIWNYNDSVRWMYRLDLKFTHRLQYARQSLDRFGVHLFGTKVHWVGYGLKSNGLRDTGDYLYVDNMYFNFLQRFGWIAFLIALALVTYAAWRLYCGKQYFLLVIFTLLAVHGLLDNLILLLSYNTFWIAAAWAAAAGPPLEVDYD